MVHRVAHWWHGLLIVVALIIVVKFIPPIELVRTGWLTHWGSARCILPAHRTENTHSLVVQIVRVRTYLLYCISHRLIKICILVDEINIGHRVLLRILPSISILINVGLRCEGLLKRLIRAHFTNHIGASFWAFNSDIRTMQLCSTFLAFLGLLFRDWEAPNELGRGYSAHRWRVFSHCLLILAIILPELFPQSIEVLR